MRMIHSAIALPVIVAALATHVRSEEPYEEFIQGLRDRRYYDYALLYLDKIREDPYAPAEIKATVPFEKASTLLVMARSGGITNPEVQSRQLEEALAYLDQFIKESPRHARAGEANTERARILLGQARIEVWQSRSPGNKENRGEFQNRARGQIDKARAIFKTAHDQHEAAWKKFPKFIDRSEDPQQFKARNLAETRYMLAQLDLAHCTYEEAQTYDQDSDGFKNKLKEAALQYEEIHTKYRSQIGGLFARTWQGKCFEEQGDIKRALGIYKELLDHKGTSSSLRNLQDQVRQFRLICLNRTDEHVLVILEADEWLTQARGRKKYSQVALGIRWEQSLAQEARAENRETSEDQKRVLLNQALTSVKTVKRFPGQYKDLAMFRERDLMVKLRGADGAGDPEDFDTAYGLAEELVTKKTKELQDKLKNARASGDKTRIKAASDEFTVHLDNTTRLLKLALRLVEPDTLIADVNRTRYFLAYMHLLSRNNYEGAILAGFIAEKYGKDNPVQAQDAAYMSLAAFVQAFNDLEAEAKNANEATKKELRASQEVDVKLMEDMANLLATRWPASDRAMDARIQMGSIHSQLGQHEKAGDWYKQVPTTASRYTSAQTQAGQAYWSAYIDAANLPEDRKPSQEQLDDWTGKAQQHLRTGIDRGETDKPPAGKQHDALIAAKVSLVQILVAKGDYKGGIEELTQDPYSVINAIQVEDESKRPTGGGSITSVKFASLAYQLLLRCYVGTGQLNEARAAMQSLEKIGGTGGEGITEIYRQLGEELKSELDRLKGLGQQTQLATVRQSFETFLDDMFKRPDQTVGSLTWIATTYFALAEGSVDQPAQSEKYYANAATTFQKIIENAEKDEKFIDAARLKSVKLRLVTCLRYQNKYEQALTLVKELLAAKAAQLDGQVEAAMVFQDWGASGQPDHYLSAVRGDKEAKIWGWGQLGRRLQMLLESGGQQAKAKYGDRIFEVRHNQIVCRIGYARAQTASARSAEEYERANMELTAFVRTTGDFTDEWFGKFDTLYRQILEGQGKPVVALERPELFDPENDLSGSNAAIAAEKKSKKKGSRKSSKSQVAKKEEGGSTMALVMFGVVSLLGLGGGVLMIKGAKKKRPSLISQDEAAPVIAPPPAAPPRKKRSAAKPPGAGTAAKPAAAGEKRKRPLTPEEKEKLARRKAAQAKAKQQGQRRKPEGGGKPPQ